MDINQDVEPTKFIAIFNEVLKNSNMTKTEIGWSFGMDVDKMDELLAGKITITEDLELKMYRFMFKEWRKQSAS